MNSQADGRARTRLRKLLWPAGIFFVTAFFFLLLGRWFDVLFFVTFGLFILFDAEVARLPKLARYLLTAALAVLVVIKFVMLVRYLTAQP